MPQLSSDKPDQRPDYVRSSQVPSALHDHDKADFAKNNLLEIPSISVPKGGGALRSIDEKFQVNPANGTATSSITLPISQSRSSLTPSLSLSYSSGAGNSAFGAGWDVGLPSIRRRTEKLLPQYRDADNSDVFQLSGAEDLIPSLVQDKAGNWLPDVTTTGSYTIKRYRPRIESGFTLIELIEGTSSKYWKTTSGSNLVTLYGLTPQARVVDPADPTLIFDWLPELVYDDRGSCYQYFYKQEDMTNVPALLHERNRLNGNQPFTNIYLKSVRYGNVTPYSPGADSYNPNLPETSSSAQPNAYLFQLVFDYGDHNSAAPTPTADQPWPARLDPFSHYKAGFEIRSYRLCRRILLFHHFKELDTDPVVVKSIDLEYAYFDFQAPADPYTLSLQEVDLLVKVTETGWKGTTTSGYQTRSYPPATYSYQLPTWSKEVQLVLPENLQGAPEGLTAQYQFTDLYNEGIAGILSEQQDGWYYNNNLGNGVFTPSNLVCPKPSFTGLSDGSLTLQPLAGDGRKFIVSTQLPNQGYFQLTDDQQWEAFQCFDRYPRIDPGNKNIKFMDLNGDGMAEIVLSEEMVFTWYPAAGIAGYDAPWLTDKPFDEEKGAAVVFADEVECIFLADMTGDGLTDIVRIRNGEVSYWPNMGYGKFGAKVNMSNAPVFDDPAHFNPSYIRLQDINGTGATDLIYLGHNDWCAWLNLSGNAWGTAAAIVDFPATAFVNAVSVTDLLGNGTACVTWSSPLPTESDAPLRYIDLMGGRKPYLMTSYTNGMGKQTQIEFASSTLFYIKDKLAGTPWITRLPMPVHVVTSVTIDDAVSGSSYSSTYSYHHGYYDHAEKEFRGFGRVEQIDSDDFDTNADADQVPVLTKTWFHTGAYFGVDRILRHLSHEYFQNPSFKEYQLPEPVLPAGLDADEAREACRACKGMVLRQETYGLDASTEPVLSAYPYSVTEHNNQITLLQPRGDNPYAAYLTVESELIAYHYERNPADPRIGHTLNIAFDEYGNLLHSYAVAYPRRQPIDMAHPGGMSLPGNQPLPAAVATEQQTLYILYSENAYTSAILPTAGDRTYRLPVPCTASTYQATGITPSADWFSIADLAAPAGAVLQRLKSNRTLFLADDLTTVLPLYTMDKLGLTYQNYHLAFDAAVTGLHPSVDAGKLNGGKYVLLDGDWWIPSGTVNYLSGGAPLPFLLPYQFIDSFGNTTTLAYDSYWLSTHSITDELGNRTTVSLFDYRVLSPLTILDANDNATDVRYDILGLPTAQAIRGKGEGDVFDIGFVNDLTPAQIAGFFSDPITNGPALLQGATSRYLYQFPDPSDPTLPFSAGSVTRRLHANQPLDGRVDTTTALYQYKFEYTDGLGRSAMSKVQADLYTGTPKPGGDCLGGDPPTHRWIGTGKTVYNNKGKAVMQYEPYFSNTAAYEEAPVNGVTPILHYDAVGRLVRTALPDGSFSKTEFDAWVQICYDPNDTVLGSDWYTQHMASPDALQVDAATKAKAHDSTPAAAHLDPLGRNFYSVSFNVTGGVQAFYAIQTVLDLDGNVLRVIDAMGNTVMQYQYDRLNRVVHQLSMDAGDRWMLHDAMDKPLYQWDVSGATAFVYRYEYDQLHRPLNSYITLGGIEYLFAYNIYGEGISINGLTDIQNNLRKQLYRQFDDSGLVTHYSYDFKGNLVQNSRVLAKAYKPLGVTLPAGAANILGPVNQWSGNPATDMALLEADPVSHQLQENMSLVQYDAFNRPILQVRPFLPPAAEAGKIIALPYTPAVTNSAEVTVPGYGESGTINTVDVYYQGGVLATPYVTQICHNEKGQRLCIRYGNNTVTRYTYDPDTFRLTRMLTTANSGAVILQDMNYYYDPVGNITYLLDKAQPPVFYNNQQVLSDGNYEYDAVYRLISATGREQIGQNTVDEGVGNTDYANYPFDAMAPTPSPTDARAMRAYTQLYTYDATDNMTQLRHVAGTASYTRTFAYNNNAADRATFGVPAATPFNNQLLATTIGGRPVVPYSYDGHGLMKRLPQLSAMAWNFKDLLSATAQQATGGAVTGEATWYNYDAGGIRVRKVTEGATNAGGTPKRSAERLYLGSYEVYRSYDGAGNLVLERATMLMTDGSSSIAILDNKTIDTAHADATLLNTWYPRYQYSNHLGSAAYELDDSATIISYEEYHPFGTTSYEAANSALDVPAKRYRYTGKERDEESGLYYHGARYYAPWLCRWTAPDLIGIGDGCNVYAYVRNNPIRKNDPGGTDCAENTSCDPNDAHNYNSLEDFRQGVQGPMSDEGIIAAWDAAHPAPEQNASPNTDAAPAPSSPAPDPTPTPAPAQTETVQQPVSNWQRYGIGGLQLLGCGLEGAMTAGLCIAPDPTLLTKVGCGVGAVHTADTCQAAVRTLATGTVTTTFTHQVGAYGATEVFHADPSTAQWVGTGLDVAASMGPSLGVGIGRALTASTSDATIQLATRPGPVVTTFLQDGSAAASAQYGERGILGFAGHSKVGIPVASGGPAPVWVDLAGLPMAEVGETVAPKVGVYWVSKVPVTLEGAASARQTVLGFAALGEVPWSALGPNCSTTAVTLLRSGGVILPAGSGLSPTVLAISTSAGWQITALGAGAGAAAPQLQSTSH